MIFRKHLVVTPRFAASHLHGHPSLHWDGGVQPGALSASLCPEHPLCRGEAHGARALLAALLSRVPAVLWPAGETASDSFVCLTADIILRIEASHVFHF